MSKLDLERFEEFFKALNGPESSPFPWQKRLAERVIGTGNVSGSWPKVLDLPTASGKTACLDIAIYALACQADLPTDQRTMARRIFFVVDRRIIVDEAMERAQKIERKLAEAGSGILLEVANALRSLSSSSATSPLRCFRLRGGVRREDEWARDPLQPEIITSTVDQFGSRLLFRGYGVSRSMRPIYAAMTGNDSLIILDEAHCAKPFSQTMAAVERYRSWASSPIPSPFGCVLMTATPPPGLVDVLGADEADLSNPVLAARLTAPKPTKLVVAQKAKGRGALQQLAEKLTEQALAMRRETPQAIAIMVNRVPTARYVHDLLRKRTKDDLVLVTGRMRPIDRDEVDKWLKRVDASISRDRRLEKNIFVVSTQCLEVGANLDFDAMVSECASIDSLRQRFGRLNRMGRPIEAQGAIVVRLDQTELAKNPKDEDPIYGASLPRTWQWLNSIASDENVDMGFNSLDSRLKSQEVKGNDELLAPTLEAPIMFPGYLDCWVQTNPEPDPDPELSTFLHGPQRGEADIEVCWRADLDGEDESGWIDTASLCPPTSSELLPVPPYIFRRWFRGMQSPDSELTDVEGALARDEDGELATPRHVLVWRGGSESEVVSDPSEIRSGDVVVLPSSAGGWESLGHVPNDLANPVGIDRGDESAYASGKRIFLRLHPTLISGWPAFKTKSKIIEMVTDPNLAERLDDKDFVRELNDALKEMVSDANLPERTRSIVKGTIHRKRSKTIVYPHGPGLVIWDDKPDVSSRDRAGSSAPVTLTAHSDSIARIATEYCSKSLPGPLSCPVVMASKLHDIGKADIRFQALLRGGDLRAAAAGKDLLAKSDWTASTFSEYEQARVRAGYPKGGRHELLSARLAEQTELGDEQDLVIHLISSHHGRCRPFAPVVWDQSPHEVAFVSGGSILKHSSDTGLDSLDSGVSDRFWVGVRQFGWWGEAYLEAIVRLADHRSSEYDKLDETTDEEGME